MITYIHAKKTGNKIYLGLSIEASLTFYVLNALKQTLNSPPISKFIEQNISKMLDHYRLKD